MSDPTKGKALDRPKSESHLYRGVDRVDGKHYLDGWVWLCSCGSKGRSTEEGYAPYGWYGHFFRATGVVHPRNYQPWMRQGTEERHGLRAADVQRAHAMVEHPDKTKYPWGLLTPNEGDLL